MSLVICFVMFGLAALVVDLGLARNVDNDAQNAADASALAAANALYPGSVCSDGSSKPPCLADAVERAMDYAKGNYGVTDWSGCPATAPEGYKAVTGSPGCISFDDLAKPKHVWVVMPPRRIDTPFGAAEGVSTVDVSERSRANVDGSPQINCGMCFLGPIDSGNADYTVEGGSIAVNGNDVMDVSTDMGPEGQMTATGQGSVVAIAGTFDPDDNYDPADVVEIDGFADPLAGRSLPTATDIAKLSPKSGPCETSQGNKTTPGAGPGIYGDEAISGTCNLEPGLYVITGTWSLKNNDLLNNKSGGVTLYFTCGSPKSVRACASGGEAGGQLFGKNGDTDLTGPSSGLVAGFPIVYDRNNTSSVQLQGNGRAKINGGLYARMAKLEYNGNSCFTFNGGPIVVDGVIKGNGNKACVKVINSINAPLPWSPGVVSLDR